MMQRDTILVLGTLVVAIGLSAILFVGAAATAPAVEPSARPRVFFDSRNPVPPARSITDAQGRVPQPFNAIVPLQRGISDTARDAAGFLLVLLVTASTLVLANDQVVSAYRASLGGWRASVRVFATGVAVLGLGISAVILGWVVFLGFVAGVVRGTPFGVSPALQVGLTAFAVLSVFVLLVLAVGFAATAWRLGDALFRVRGLSRLAPQVPAPLVAVVGATILYVIWQIPALGAIALGAVVAHALGAVVTARLVKEGSAA